MEINIPKPDKKQQSIEDDLNFFVVDEEKPTAKAVQKSPKELLKQFLLESQEDEPYMFTLQGSSSIGHSFIHKMRVELSRYRAKVRKKGLVVKRFKIFTVSIEEHNGHCEITLIRTMKSSIDGLATEIIDDDLLDVLSHGEKK